MLSNLTEKLELNTYRYLKEILVETNQEVKSGDKLLKYTNGTYLYAPYDCVIKSINVGKVDEICTSAHFIEVSDTNNLLVTLNIDESELSNVAVGQEVQVKLNAYDNKTYTGKIVKKDAIGSYASSGSTFTITIGFENDGEANIGMSAYCVITIDKAENVVAIPVAAVQRRGASSYVLVVKEDGTTQEKTVEIGLSNSFYVEIKSGLSVGETVQYTDTSSNSNNSRGGTFSSPSVSGGPVVMSL